MGNNVQNILFLDCLLRGSMDSPGFGVTDLLFYWLTPWPWLSPYGEGLRYPSRVRMALGGRVCGS